MDFLRLHDKIKFYSQFILDELTLSEFTKKDGWWGNKFGIQAGLKHLELVG